MTAYAISEVEMLDETQGQRYRELGGRARSRISSSVDDGRRLSHVDGADPVPVGLRIPGQARGRSVMTSQAMGVRG
jgi:hypothetical protein